MLTSAQNPKIKWIRSLQTNNRVRRREGLFVIEGVRLVEEALKAGWDAQLIIHSEDLSNRGQSIVAEYLKLGVQIEAASTQVMRTASDTETPQGILGVIKHQALPLSEEPDFLLILDQIRDPGNLGTILRTSLAAGVQGVLLPPGSADAFAPKVLRAGMGAHFHLPIQTLDWNEIIPNLHHINTYLAASGAGEPHTKSDLRSPLALIIGGETEGASDQAQANATAQIHIPMPGGSESLNAAIACAVLLFEVIRQRNEGR